MKTTLLVLAGLALLQQAAAQASCNQQTKDYYPSTKPQVLSAASADVTVFFSPDHSVKVLTDLVLSATESIDIANPHWKSWIDSDCDIQYGPGCYPSEIRGDPFPIWAAVLNAVHSGIKVRFLTNYCDYEPGEGKIGYYAFLMLNGVELRGYSDTAYMHAKYIAVDGKVASVSSINFSEDSFMNNREAGVNIENNPEITGYLGDWFESDFNNGVEWPHPNQTYSSYDMGVITNTAPIPVIIPAPMINCSYQAPTPAKLPVSGASITTFLAPDFAYDTLMSEVKTVQSQLQVMIYEITSDDICTAVETLSTSGVNVTIIVSDNVVSRRLRGSRGLYTNECYEKLIDAGVDLRKSATCYSFAHQKFWLTDGVGAGLSTGNWADTDFPYVGTSPITSSDADHRDANMFFKDPAVFQKFSSLFWEEWAHSTRY